MKAVTKEERRVAYPLVLIFVSLSLGIVVGGAFYYRYYEQQFRAATEQQLSAIAELKVDELAQYRKERLGDANDFFNNVAFSGLVRRFLERPEDAEAQEQLRAWLNKYHTDYQYDRVFLLDTQGVERISSSVTAAPVSAVVSRRVAEVLRSREIAFQDFYRNEHNQRIYLTLLVPILDGVDHSQALGVLVLRIDPATYLYPFIKRWPTPSRTAETLLVRRDGNEALFLNELKFETNTALNLRIPLTSKDVPAVKAILGQEEGIVEGMDYRGVSVLAALQAIPDSPWFLVARMDAAEVYAPLRERLWLTILLVGALLAGAGAGAGAIGRHQRARVYKERSKVAEALRESEERFRRVFEEGPTGMAMLDEAFRFIQVNPAFSSMLGYSEEEMRTMAFTDITHPDHVQRDIEHMRRLLRGELSVYRTEKRYIAKSGKELWGQVQVAVVRNADGAFRYFLAIISDIAARKEAEEELRNSQALYYSLVENLPQSVFRKDRAGCFQFVNERFSRGLGRSPEDIVGKTDADFFPPELAQAYRKDDLRVMETGQVLDQEEKHVGADGRELFVHVLKTPLRDAQGQIIGIQGVFWDITERKQAEGTIASERQLLRTLIDLLPETFYIKDLDSRFLVVNESLVKLVGKDTPAQILGLSDADFFPAGMAAGFRAEEMKVFAGEPLINHETSEVYPDGREHTILTTKLPFRDSQGRICGLVGIGHDITERKRVEQVLAERTEEVVQRNLELAGTNTTLQRQIAERERIEQDLDRERLLMRTLIDNLPDYIYAKDAEGRFVIANVGVARQLGFSSPNEVIGKSDFDLFPHELATRYHAEEQKIIRSGQGLYNHEGPTVDAGKKEKNRWVSTTKVPLRNAQGEIAGFIGLGHDITEIKQAQEALHYEQTLMATLMKTLPDQVYFKDAASRFLRVNPAMARRFGLSDPAQVVGKTDADFFTEEHASQTLADEQEIIRTGQSLVNIEEKETWPDGSETWVLTTKLPLRDDTGRIIGTCGISSNITKHKQAEETLRRNEERLLKVVMQTRCILQSGQVEGLEGWRERALNPVSPFHWDIPVQNEETAQKIFPLELAAGEQYQQAWYRTWNRDDHTQMNWNSGNAFLNGLPFYRNEFRCIDKHGVGHWMQQFVTVRKLAENRWEVFCITTDISDLKRVETELRESQALYHSLVDQMPAAIFRKDSNGRYVFVNSVFCRLKEMSPDRFFGKTDLELGLTDAALATKGASDHATIMQSGNPIEDDEVYSGANGETRNYHAVKSPVFNSAGKIVGTQGVLFDITERKRAEQDLEQAFQRQRGISRLHEKLLASWPLCDKLQLVTETIVRLFDADFCRIWLTRPGDLCEQGCMHALVTEGPHVCRRREICLHLLASAGRYTHLDGAKHRRVPYGVYKIGRIAAGKETKFLINNVLQDPLVHDREWAKELGLVSFAGYRLQSPGGAPLGVLALFAKRPLTAQEDVLLESLSNATTSILLTHLAEDESRRELAERKRAEEALHWSETQLHVILESTADGLLAVDSKGKVIETNQRFAELWRIPQSLMDAGDDRALLDFVLKQLSDPDAFLKKVQSLYGTDALDMDTLVFKDGRVFERYSFPMIMDGAVIGRVWSFRDITGRKRQEKELSEKNTELERFTYTVSHDLKSPLVTVKTFLGYLEQDLARPDKERVKQDVAYMHTAADKMGQLLDELLNLARVGHKMNPAERVTFKELAQEAVRLVAGRISTGGAEVQVADATVVLKGDRPRLMEIWQNLVENACKFMGNQPQPRVEIGVEKRGSETVFFVRDNGAGIDPRFQAKVFGLFEKLDPKGEGTGMGLALVKRIVEMYKGRIWVESPGLGQGANFLFTLPGAVIIDPEQSS
jgi:PAS domain S-box-containing protein